VRKAVVMLDAGFEAVLATVLLMGIVYAVIDEDDFPAPASDVVIALFAFGLLALAVALATLVKNENLSDAVLGGLAAMNAGFGLILAAWVLLADGFSHTGRTVIWVTVAALLALAASQALARARR
jgi:uncharacterized membrane protein